jgi:hypothetical protein
MRAGPPGIGGGSAVGGAEAEVEVEGGGMMYFEDGLGASNRVHGVAGCWSRMVGMNRGSPASAGVLCVHGSEFKEGGMGCWRWGC